MIRTSSALSQIDSNPFFRGDVAGLVFSNATRKFPSDVEFRLKFIEILREFKKTEVRVISLDICI